MAPLRPSSSSSKSSTNTRPKKVVARAGIRTSFPSRKSESSLGDSKRDKRQVKHSLLLSRAEQSSKADSAGVRKSSLKRRRKPATKGKLNADLLSLLDTLPDTAATGTAASSKVGGPVIGSNITIASKPGAQKKKEKIAQAERERMGKNLAAMAVGGGAQVETQEGSAQGAEGSQIISSADKWAAIREHIAQSMAG